ncbi:MAG TPA: PfkB family carbohydrate kinase [Candidatus Hydrogenedentes bacterium]|nr:PfkB family carbohydrate kinase [Candidatus Hydrogenedentota bacterium]
MTHHDLLILGAVSKDIIITPENVEHSIGGAVVYSAVALKHLGANILAVTKLNPEDRQALEVFDRHGVPYRFLESPTTTSIRNTYHTADRDRRTCEALGMAAPFTLNDVPDDVTAEVYYLGGLMKGEFPEAFVLAMTKRGKVAIDAQGFMRVNENGPMVFRDWENKKEVIAAVHYLKTDAAEAETLTGEQDRKKAIQILASWGAKEIMLTHHTEVMVCVDGEIFTAPFTARNLSGRTGRGDTCFASYCYRRIEHTPEEACRFAAAVTSRKMEHPGPFTGNINDISDSIL